MKVRAVLFYVLTFAMISTANAGVWRVEQDGSGDFTEIQQAVDMAASGDTILIGPGDYTEQVADPELAGWTACAFWNDTRDLAFIGAGRGLVNIGLESYDPSRFEAGIVANGDAVLRIESVRFVNMRVAVGVGYGESYVSDCEFESCYWGVQTHQAERCVVSDCGFVSIEEYSVTLYNSQGAVIDSCTMDSARINFNNSRGVVRDCEVTGGGFVSFYLSSGVAEGCTVRCNDDRPCISVSDCDTVEFYDNTIVGGQTNITLGGASTNVFAERNAFSDPAQYNIRPFGDANLFAHDNHIQRAFDFIQDYIVYTSGYSHSYERTIDMSNNYWFADGILGRLDDLIWDGNDDGSINVIVEYEPIREEPVAAEETSLGGLKALFR